MALTLSVTYDDGSTEAIVIRPAGIMAAERKFGGDMPEVEGTMYAAWFLKGMPGGDFDAWVGGLADATTKNEAALPLAQEPSPEG